MVTPEMWALIEKDASEDAWETMRTWPGVSLAGLVSKVDGHGGFLVSPMWRTMVRPDSPDSPVALTRLPLCPFGGFLLLLTASPLVPCGVCVCLCAELHGD